MNAATTFNDEPNAIARLFQLPVLQGGLPRYAETEAEHRYRPLRLQKVQDDGAPVVGQPIQFYELDGTARQSQATGHAALGCADTRLPGGLKRRLAHQAGNSRWKEDGLLLRRAPLRKRFAFVAGNDVEIVSFRFQTAERIWVRTPAARKPGLCRIVSLEERAQVR